MSWNEFIYGIADLLEASFAILPKLGNIPNVFFILIIFGAFVYWLMQLNKFKKEAVKAGTKE